MAGAFSSAFNNDFDIGGLPPGGGDDDRNTRRGIGIRHLGLRRGGRFAFLIASLYLAGESIAALASQVYL